MDKEMLIQKFFENDLTEVEQQTFNTLNSTDVDFASEVANQTKIKQAITAKERNRLKSKVQAFETSKKQRNNWWFAAASIFVLIAMSILLKNQNPSHEKLYASYFEVFPNVVKPIVRNDNSEISIKTQAFIAYENNDYENAILFFNQIAVETQDEYAVFYKAMSLMDLNRVIEASNALEQTRWSKNYEDKALWYLALAQLKLNDIEACKATLNKLIATGQFNKSKAKSLLEQLD